MTEKQWYTSGEAAKIACVSQSWIIRMMKEGRLPFVYFGGRRKISKKTLCKLTTKGLFTT
jgi:excisionase family DNA binding protein